VFTTHTLKAMRTSVGYSDLTVNSVVATGADRTTAGIARTVARNLAKPII
jgi:hypothetical protein